MTSEDRDSPHHYDGAGSRSSASVTGQGAGRGSDKPPKPKRKQLPLWQESILLMAVALVMAVLVKAFFVQAFYIPSESMEPGLVENDRILVQKISYWGSGEAERGDVVVFKDPGSWLPEAAAAGSSNPIVKVMTKIGLYPEGGHLVKRVVGVAGDVIECCDDDGNLLVNGEPVEESAYVKDNPNANCNGPMTGNCSWKAGPVPEGHIFVMGDNRAASADSSYHLCRDGATECVGGREFVPTDLVVGRLFTVIWPLTNMRLDRRPDSFDAVPAAEK
ncbi:signal peptidase I [Nocardioides gilvus]|uniref:signal peptidase I n=1 Tax=Nocardioides gilvus TaxID=1735589 RepID=UPI001EF443AE|nr:signal peptidase I [Nocardioides gilvus]